MRHAFHLFPPPAETFHPGGILDYRLRFSYRGILIDVGDHRLRRDGVQSGHAGICPIDPGPILAFEPGQPGELPDLLRLFLHIWQLRRLPHLANLHIPGSHFPVLAQAAFAASHFYFLFFRFLHGTLPSRTPAPSAIAGNAGVPHFLCGNHLHGLPHLHREQLKLRLRGASFYRDHLRGRLHAAHDGLPGRLRASLQPACPAMRVLHRPGARHPAIHAEPSI